jgi:hypothetical protein
MSFGEILSILGVVAAALAPLLVYLAASSRLRFDRQRSRSADESSLWERMASMVDRYGRRADDLDNQMVMLRQRLTAAEERADSLAREVSRLQLMVDRWRAYALALMHQMRSAGIQPVDLRSYGLEDEE